MLRDISFGKSLIGAHLAGLLNDIDSPKVTNKVMTYFNRYQAIINQLVISCNIGSLPRQTTIRLLMLLRQDILKTIGIFGTMNVARDSYEEPSTNPFIETALRNVLIARLRLALKELKELK